MTRRFALSTLSSLLLHRPSMASAAPSAFASSGAPPVRIDAGGGAVAFLGENHDLPLVDIALAFRSGAALEANDRIGSTRLMGRMLRRGTKSMSAEKIEEALDRLGGEVSVDVSSSSINVHAQVIRRNLAPFVKLLTEILLRPTFDADELARLKREAVAELVEARDNDKGLASRFFRRAVFGAHPLGRGLSGTTKTIPLRTRAELLDAHALHLRRGNVVLGVAGDIDRAALDEHLLPLVAALPNGPALKDPSTEPTMAKGRRLVFVDKPARTQTQILIGGLGTHPLDPDHVALHVGNTAFGGTFTARLMKEVRSKRGWSYGAYARLPIDRRREAFSMWTFPAATDAAACVALELELLEAWLAEGITKEELAFSRSYLSESYAFDVDTPFKRVRQAVDEEVYGLPSDYHTGYVARVGQTTLDAANAAIKKRISRDDLAVVVVGTAGELAGAIGKAIPNLASTEILPYDFEP
ncbi:MAG: insulinase family protein [Myxococcales bacterium]|nr:insulinase family protein [Myxococcales bacterium]